MNCRRCNTPIPSRSSSCPNCGQQVGPGETFIDDPGESGVLDAGSEDETPLGPSMFSSSEAETDAADDDVEIDLEDEAELSLDDAVVPEASNADSRSEAVSKPAESKPAESKASTSKADTPSKSGASKSTPTRASGKAAARASASKAGRKAAAKPGKKATARPKLADPTPSSPVAAAKEGALLPDPETVRRILAQHPELIEPGLEVLTDESGSEVGVKHPTDVGVIDLLARDASGALVAVIVVEPGRGGDIVAESLHRLGWVRKHLAKSGEEVRGVVLTERLEDEVAYAAAAVAGTLQFKSYALSLSLVDLDV